MLKQNNLFQENSVDVFKMLDFEDSKCFDPISFYRNVRGIVVESLGKRGDYVDWKQETLAEDEEMTVTHEDTILLLVLSLLHPKLPSFIRDIYSDRLRGNKRILDYRTDIFKDANIFLYQSSDVAKEDKKSMEEEVNSFLVIGPDSEVMLDSLR